MRANVYVDGFNLYYGCLKNTPHKWLNLRSVAENLLRGHDVRRIRYFTAHVHDRPDKVGQAVRQQMYLRALGTLPGLSVHLGHFKTEAPKLPLVTPLADGTKFVKVYKTDEKGSDVNLACWMLLDAAEDDFDVAAVISNDSDLETPVRMVRDNYRKKVFVMMPRDRHSAQLTAAATACRPIRPWVIAQSQFALELPDAAGRIIKCPERWRLPSAGGPR